MSNLQTVHAGDHAVAGATASAEAEGLFANPGGMIWLRHDWAGPVGSCAEINFMPRSSRVGELELEWTCVELPEFWLSHRAALLLLQGMSLSKILLPNHYLIAHTEDGVMNLRTRADLVLRVERWQAARAVPALQGLVLALLPTSAASLDQASLLSALVAGSTSA
jgi:hypothetical protein